MIKMYESLYDIMIELLPFYMIPITIMVLNALLRIVKGTVNVSYTKDLEEELMKRKEEPKKEDKISIDKDLQKYFNYKE